jgi:hypothetical protein
VSRSGPAGGPGRRVARAWRGSTCCRATRSSPTRNHPPPRATTSTSSVPRRSSQPVTVQVRAPPGGSGPSPSAVASSGPVPSGSVPEWSASSAASCRPRASVNRRAPWAFMWSSFLNMRLVTGRPRRSRNWPPRASTSAVAASCAPSGASSAWSGDTNGDIGGRAHTTPAPCRRASSVVGPRNDASGVGRRSTPYAGSSSGTTELGVCSAPSTRASSNTRSRAARALRPSRPNAPAGRARRASNTRWRTFPRCSRSRASPYTAWCPTRASTTGSPASGSCVSRSRRDDSDSGVVNNIDWSPDTTTTSRGRCPAPNTRCARTAYQCAPVLLGTDSSTTSSSGTPRCWARSAGSRSVLAYDGPRTTTSGVRSARRWSMAAAAPASATRELTTRPALRSARSASGSW